MPDTIVRCWHSNGQEDRKDLYSHRSYVLGEGNKERKGKEKKREKKIGEGKKQENKNVSGVEYYDKIKLARDALQ